MGLRTSRELDVGSQWDLITKLPQDWGKQALGGHKQNLVCTRNQEKGAVPPQVIELEFPVRLQESLVESLGQHFGLRPDNREGT